MLFSCKSAHGRPRCLFAGQRLRPRAEFVDDGFLLTREAEAEYFHAIEREADLVAIGLANAKIRRLPGVQCQAKIHDCRLQIDSQTAVRLQRINR